jgi:hypothetical protein
MPILMQKPPLFCSAASCECGGTQQEIFFVGGDAPQVGLQAPSTIGIWLSHPMRIFAAARLSRKYFFP